MHKSDMFFCDDRWQNLSLTYAVEGATFVLNVSWHAWDAAPECI
jgi:hypothetical protein